MCALTHRVLALSVLLVTASLPALAQEVGVVSGRVMDEEGVPLPGAVVTLSGPAILGVMETPADSQGRYWFPAVPGNKPLTIRAVSPGRTPLAYVGHTARRGGSISIDFTLRRPGDHRVLVLIEQGVPYHRMALEGALSTMPGSAQVMPIDGAGPASVRLLLERLRQRPSAVLAIGERAARLARRHVKDVPIIYSMVPAPMDADLTTNNVCGVPLNGGFAEQVEHLRHVLPEARRIGTVYDPHRLDESIRALREAAREGDLEIVAAHLHGGTPAAFEAALEELRGRDLDAFMLLIDPAYLDGEAFDRVAAFVEEEGIVLAVPDPSLTVLERSFAFVPGFYEMGAFAGTLVRRIVSGQTDPRQIGMIFPDRAEMDERPTMIGRLTPREVLPGEASDAVALSRDE